MTTEIFRDVFPAEFITEIKEYCPRCNEKEMTDDGVCRNCSFKCWYGYH